MALRIAAAHGARCLRPDYESQSGTQFPAARCFSPESSGTVPARRPPMSPGQHIERHLRFGGIGRYGSSANSGGKLRLARVEESGDLVKKLAVGIRRSAVG